MGVLYHAVAEGAHTELYQGSVVEDLRGDVCQVDGLLEVAHHHEVARLKPAVVQRVVVDVAQHGTRFNPVEILYMRSLYDSCNVFETKNDLQLWL